MTTYKIKPLVWLDTTGATTVEERWGADVFGMYFCVIRYGEAQSFYLYVNETDMGIFNTLEYAKSAAQSHYEARLKECLEEVENV